jgi:hypothetical protein
MDQRRWGDRQSSLGRPARDVVRLVAGRDVQAARAAVRDVVHDHRQHAIESTLQPPDADLVAERDDGHLDAEKFADLLPAVRGEIRRRLRTALQRGGQGIAVGLRPGASLGVSDGPRHLDGLSVVLR